MCTQGCSITSPSIIESEIMAVEKIEHSPIRHIGQNSVEPVDSRHVLSMKKERWFSEIVINSFVPAAIGRLQVASESILYMNTYFSTVIDETS